MNSCKGKNFGRNTKNCHSSDVALVTASIPNMANLVYITLAKENPIQVLESDEDFYNSSNEQETDICHDTSDLSDTETNSQCSSTSNNSLSNEPLSTIATMEVLEYEVASASESVNDFSYVSSSGTDDYVLAAFAQAVADNSSATEFAILADTEESDDQAYDSDFAPADYWKCIKCNNKQNNPMYRYCEKCYQVRKSLFPPRPKQKRKTRFKKIVEAGELSDSSASSSSKSVVSNISHKRCIIDSRKFYKKSSMRRQPFNTVKISDSDSDIVIGKTKAFRQRTYNYIGPQCVYKKLSTKKQPYNTVKITDGDSDIVIDETTACRQCADNNVNKLTNNENTAQDMFEKQISLTSSIINNHKRKFSDESLNYEAMCSKKRFVSEVLLPEVTDMKNKHLQLDVFKDSGFSSSSSQEQTPTEDKCVYDETFSRESIQSNRTSHHDITKFDSAANQKPNSCYMTLSKASCESTSSTLDDDPYYNKHTIMHEVQLDRSDILKKSEHNLGLCMFCLTQPKNSVFVHSNFVHLCCCYKCAMKIWRQRKSCPICNCKVRNVMKLFVH